MRIENWKEFEHDCDLLGYDVFAAETEAQLQYGDDAWDALTDDEKQAAFERFSEINNPEYYESPKYTRWAVNPDEDDADDYTEEIATAIIRERDGLGVDAFDNLIKLYFNKYM